MTKVINLLSGSGSGKSTTAAGIFYEAKLRGIHCEMVREYVKQWAWEGRKIGPYDQPNIFGNQTRQESLLYGKVDLVVTDSPLLLSPIYEYFYTGSSIIESFALAFIDKAKRSGVEHHNFILKRNKSFDPRGRYETAEQANEVDKLVESFLTKHDISYIIVDTDERERVNFVLSKMGY